MAYRYTIEPLETKKTNVFKPMKLAAESAEARPMAVKPSQIGAAFMGNFHTLLKGNKRAAVVWEAPKLKTM